MLALWLLAGTLIGRYIFQAWQTWCTRVPGPWFANVTRLVLIYYEWTRRRRQYIHGLHEQYGDVVRLAPDQVSFINLEGMKEIYQSGGSGYDKSDFYDMFKQYDQRTMFSMLGREEHAQRKKLFAERYAMTNVARPEVMVGISTRAMKVVEKCKASAGSHLDAYFILHCYAIDGVSHLLFNPGGTDTLGNPSHREYVEELTYYDNMRRRMVEMYLPWLHKILSRFETSTWGISQRFVLDQVEQSRLGPSAVLHKLSKNPALSTVQAAAECMDHMAAGIETTGDGLCFLMHELSLPRSHHIQDKLRQELQSNPTAKLESLEYLDVVVKEGLRRFPPIPMSLPRLVPSGGRTICGYTLPENTIVSCCAYSMHLLNENVYPDAYAFKPERWFDKERLPDMNRLMFTFSAGGRGCVGKNLALLEMKTLLREVYSRFKTTLPPEMPTEMEMDDQVVASRPKDFKALLVFEEC
ncbi:putative cytochrome P450 [Elsinoe ampelina]|uniref:Putative cytochrome P450 n=1 Tax=Elsinoe ampelina TaxID=302913 RepID=A0A6A6G3K2_9PEZI|nr:putative cytochrome P450 [Elsinoe ampelina]